MLSATYIQLSYVQHISCVLWLHLLILVYIYTSYIYLYTYLPPSTCKLSDGLG